MTALPILVLGRNGQLARSLADVAAGPAGAGLALRFAGRADVDLHDPLALSRLVGATETAIVINTAGYTAVDRAESEEAEAFALNAEAPRRIARICRSRGIGLIHISTDYVFDGNKAEPYVETDPTAPLNVYGRSKLAGELAVLEDMPEALILRTAWIFGPFGANFLKTVLRLARSGRMRIVADQIGTPTASLHLAEAILAVCRHHASGTAPGGIYHVAGTGATNWADLAGEIVAGRITDGGPLAIVEPIATAGYPTAARRPMNSRLSCEKLARTFAIALPDWRLGVAESLERLRELEAGGQEIGSKEIGGQEEKSR
ncbi:MAG: dTDP-4-dehydrorhamnose reductase [Hyphomicrobiales bacterium]